MSCSSHSDAQFAAFFIDPRAKHGQWTNHSPQYAFKVSMLICPAVHIPTRSLLRSSSTPEPNMDSGQTTVRNMRSKCRCSYVLQFTFRRAVCCVLHRPPSQVIQTWTVDKPQSAICVQSVDAHMSCSSHSDAQFAAFFIDPRAKHGQWTNHSPQYAFKVSMLICPAVHIPTRSLLRSSSTPEP